MGISELEKVVREAAGQKDLHYIEGSTLSPEFAEAARTLGQRKRQKKAVRLSLFSPATSVWF